MNQSVKQKPHSLEEPEDARSQLSYRVAMQVTELAVFPGALGRPTYYVCPRCDVTMEREYQSYCDRCGQRLAWNGRKHIRIIYPAVQK